MLPGQPAYRRGEAVGAFPGGRRRRCGAGHRRRHWRRRGRRSSWGGLNPGGGVCGGLGFYRRASGGADGPGVGDEIRCGGWRSGGCRGLLRRGCRPVAAAVHFGNRRAHRHRFAFLRDDPQEFPGYRGRHFHSYLVGNDFHQRVIPFYPVARLFQPLADGAFDDALADLGQFNELWHWSILVRAGAGRRRQ